MILRLLLLLSLNSGIVYSKNVKSNAILTISQTDLNSQTSHFVRENLEESSVIVRDKRSLHDDQKVVMINPDNATVILIEEFKDSSLFEATWIVRQNVRIETEGISKPKVYNRKKRQTNEESTDDVPEKNPTLPIEETDRYVSEILDTIF